MSIALAVSVLSGCDRSRCENQAFFGLPSPDGKHIAFIFHRMCQSNGSVSTDVSVMPSTDPLRDETGNVLTVAGQQPVKVSWHSSELLVISGFRGPLYQRQGKLESVTLEFHALQSP